MNWYLYIIRCSKGTLYTGITTDVPRRYLEHCAQGKKCAKYLRGKVGLKVVYSQLVGNRAQALKTEYKIKQLTKAEKLIFIKNRVLLN